MRDWVASSVASAEDRKGKVTDAQMKKALDQMSMMASQQNWSSARPLHFVALYIHGHEVVYGIEPLELTARDRLAAAAQARRILDKHFDGDSLAFVKFVDWAWAEAKRRMKWCEANGRDASRLTWRALFGGAYLTDYLRKQVAQRPKPKAGV